MFRYKAFWFNTIKEAGEFERFIHSKIKPNINKIDGIDLSLLDDKKSLDGQYNILFAEVYSALDSFHITSDCVVVVYDKKDKVSSQVWMKGYVNKLMNRMR
jgi:hypothetical protein